MSSSAVDRYLAELERELRKRGVTSARFVEETRGHLNDSVEAGVRSGLSQDSAEQEALQRYGDVRTVAKKFAAERYRILQWVLVAPAVLVGLGIAWVDSRPHWDDTGITAGCLLLSAGLLSLIAPRRPWLLALGVGLWIPIHLILQKPTLGSVLGGLVILAIPMLGAYAGMAVRKVIGAVA